jgi:putative ABC transport system permease protein
MGNLAQDLRYGLRRLRKSPGFSFVAILTLALGIGATTAIFSVVYGVLLRPLPYSDPNRIMAIFEVTTNGIWNRLADPNFDDFRNQSHSFQEMAKYSAYIAPVSGVAQPSRSTVAHVSSDFFRVFRVQAMIGRTLAGADVEKGAAPVVVVSYGYWKQYLASSPSLSQLHLKIDNADFSVIGVLPPGFQFPKDADLWVAADTNGENPSRTSHNFNAVGRLRNGVTVAQANAEISAMGRRIHDTSSEQNDYLLKDATVVPLRNAMTGEVRPALLVLLAAVGFLLLVACANVANLLLARASARRRELATRVAIGAGRGQIIRQLLTESLVLALAGGVLGLLLGFFGVRLLLSINPGNIPRIAATGPSVALDLNVLLFTLGVSVLTGILFGLIPAIAASRPNLAATLNEGSSRSGMSLRQSRARSLLVVSEVALALVLVIGAALLIRTFRKLGEVDPGFTTHNVLTMAMSVSGNRFQTTAPVAQLVRQGQDRLQAVPGVLAAGACNCLPLASGFGMIFDILGRPRGNSPFTGDAGFYSISSGYFSSLGIPLIRGRFFNERDDASTPGVVVISQAMARRYWPQGDPLKDRIQIGPGAGPAFAEPPRQVVGIVGDTRTRSVDEDPGPMMYIPLAQMPDGETALNSQVAPLYWIVRTRENPYTVLAPIEAALREASGNLAVAHIRTMDEVEARNIARQRFNMVLLTIFGLSGLLMAAIGVYGVMSYSVQQRTQEMGVRMALGAQASNLRNMVIGQGMLLALLGVAAGLGGAFWLTRFLAGFLFGVNAWDPMAFLLTPLLLCAVALLAVWFPARRATRVDPMTALRLE